MREYELADAVDQVVGMSERRDDRDLSIRQPRQVRSHHPTVAGLRPQQPENGARVQEAPARAYRVAPGVYGNSQVVRGVGEGLTRTVVGKGTSTWMS